MSGISRVTVSGGRFAIGVEVSVASLVVKHVPRRDKQLACHGHEDFHFVFLAHLRLMAGEQVEEAPFGPAGAPSALDERLSQECVAVGDSAGLHFLVRLVVARPQAGPGGKVRRSLEFGHVDSDFCDQ